VLLEGKKMKSRVSIVAAFCAAVLLGAGVAARAASITFTATDGASKSASAAFSVSGGVLKIVLTNTSNSDTLVASDLLTGVYWSMTGAPTLSVETVLLTSGSAAHKGSTTFPIAGSDVSGEYAFKATAGAAGAHTGGNFADWSGATFGVSSSGISASGSGDGVFSAADLFNSSKNLNNSPPSPDGPDFGLATKGDKLATGLTAIPLIKDSVTITLQLPAGYTNFNPSTGIGNVWFQYGTSTSDERISSGNVIVSGAPSLVPLPNAVWMGLSTLGTLGLLGLRRRRAS
jgi:hypothetical protein